MSEVQFSRDYFIEMDVRSEDAYELAGEWFNEVIFTKVLKLGSEPEWDKLKDELRGLRRTYGRVALLLVTKKPSLIRELKKRNLRALLYVQGGDMRINRVAIETGVDALMNPWAGRKDPGFDHTLARMASRRKVAVGFSFAPLLWAGPYERAMMLRFMARVWMLVKKYQVPRFIASSARRKWEIRSPRDLMSLGIAIGMEVPEAKASLDFHPRKILERRD